MDLNGGNSLVVDRITRILSSCTASTRFTLLLFRMNMQQQQQWAPPPQAAPPNCPPGLEYLLHVDQLLIKQQVELLEAFTGFETANKYKVNTIKFRTF